MSLLYNSFRSERYLRTRFQESRYLLAQEASDMELEMIDLIKENLTNGFGATFFNGTALQVTNPSSTSLLLIPGEAWYNGLPYVLKSQGDEEWSIGNTPGGFTLAYTNTSGLQVNFNAASFAAGTYQLVIGCQEQVVTAPNDLLSTVHDPFLQNPNLATPTAEKVRLVYSINLVTASNQTSTPVPYTSQTGAYSAANLTNSIVITPAGGTTDGTVIAQSALSSKSEVDGASYTVTVYNTTGSFPTANTDLANFTNGTFVDSLGNSFHLVSVQVNSTPANSILLTLDQEIGQTAPVITNGVPYTLYKQNVYYTTQDTGVPTGFQFLPLANVVWNGTAITSITDLRTNSYFSSIRGTATDNVVTRIGVNTNAIGDEQEDRSAYLYTSSVLTWSGTQLSGATTIPLLIINSKIGGTTVHNITISNPQTLTDGNIYYVTINRGITPETLTLTAAASLPAQLQSNKNLIPIFQVTGTTLLIPLHKQTILSGTPFTLGNTGSGVTSLNTFGSSPNSSGATISGTSLTLQPASDTQPGGVSTTTQSFAGAKTFVNNVVMDGTLTIGSSGPVLSNNTGNLESLSFISGGSQGSASPVITSGTYTPTLQTSTNVLSTNFYSTYWCRVGNYVQVSGKVDIHTNGANSTISFNVPINSIFASADHLCGSAIGGNQPGTIFASGSNTAIISLTNSGAFGDTGFSYTYGYTVN